MDFQNTKQYDIFDDDINFENHDDLANLEQDKKYVEIFDNEKLDQSIKLFLDCYPNAEEYEIIDFIARTRRAFVKAKRKNISDEIWLDKLKKHIVTFKFAAPLQREIEKLMMNQELVAMQIEQTKMAKEKARLEKEKIDFLLEQNNLLKTGKSSIYPNLTTINKLEVLKKDIEKRYQNELREMQSKQKDDMQNVIDSEVERIRDEFNQRYNQWSQFYEMFKQKYLNLQNFSIKMREELNDKNNESYDLKLKINQLINELKNQENQIEILTTELDKRSQAIENFRVRQPEIIKENVERELEERMISQTNKLNSILLEKEKFLIDEIENRRNQVEQILEEKQKEYDEMVATTKEAETLLKINNDELDKVRSNYDKVVQDNELLTSEIESYKTRYKKLSEILTKLQSENSDLEKLNKLLVKKYNDSEYYEITNQKLTEEISQISKNQKNLMNLINENKISDVKAIDSFKEITKKIENIDSKMDALKLKEKQNKNNNLSNSFVNIDEDEDILSKSIKELEEEDDYFEDVKIKTSSSIKSKKSNNKSDKNDKNDSDEDDLFIDKLINIE